MRKGIVIFVILFSVFFNYAEELSQYALFFKTKYPKIYKNVFLKHATQKWSGNYSMIVFEINRQTNALFEVVHEFNKDKSTDNLYVLIRAIQKWSYDGYKEYNISLLNKKDFNAVDLFSLHCNWSMVLFEYRRQVQAKNLLK